MTADIKKMNPYKIDIGAVFTDKPKDHKKLKASEFKPLERELVFDIDMTDYDEIRTCCSGAAICKKCWFFMNTAVLMVLLLALLPFCGAVNSPAGGDTAINQVRRVMIWLTAKCIYKFNLRFSFLIQINTQIHRTQARDSAVDAYRPRTPHHNISLRVNLGTLLKYIISSLR